MDERVKMKRVIDLFIAFVGLIGLAVPMFIVSLLILIIMGRPIFFRQIRAGRNGIPFEIVKFRTMLNADDERSRFLSNKERLTRIGMFLRSCSIDELPELWNVVKGEMSIVGPRPLLLDYLPLYSKEQMRRHDVRPGITGLAQVKGRNLLSWNDKFLLDVWYVENRSIALDLQIIFLTIGKVLSRHGVDSEVTMGRFTGNEEEVRY